jgi:hypothetical protein
MEGGVRMRTAVQALRNERGARPDRVRAHSNQLQNQRIDAQMRQCLERYAPGDREAISRHIEALDREWDVERYLQMNAGIVSLSGVVLGAWVSRRFLVVPGVVFGFFLQHATQGWCPPLPIFRKMGVRTRREINREKYALKALRGDFESVPPDSPGGQPKPSGQ